MFWECKKDKTKIIQLGLLEIQANIGLGGFLCLCRTWINDQFDRFIPNTQVSIRDNSADDYDGEEDDIYPGWQQIFCSKTTYMEVMLASWLMN